MNFPKSAIGRNPFMALMVLLCSMALLSIALLPITPVHSRAVYKAYSQYLHDPTEDAKRNHENTLDRVNRPFHFLQYASAICGLGLPFIFFFVRRKNL